MPDGNILISFRHISTVAMIDRRSGEFYWKMKGTLEEQHAADILNNRNVILFDNGPQRRDSLMPYSRVLEIDPGTQENAWYYVDAQNSYLFSPIVGNAQRLENGNTLISKGWFGRLFEVTPSGDTVWEYVNPYFGSLGSASSPTAQINAVFRTYRYTAEEIAKVQATS